MIHAQNTKKVVVIKPASIATNATSTGNIDCLGYDYCSIDIIADTAAAVSNNPSVMLVKEGDTTSSFAAVPGLTGDTDFTIANADTANAAITTLDINLKARKRYLQVSLTAAGAATIYAVTATLSRAEQAPTTATNRGVLQVVTV